MAPLFSLDDLEETFSVVRRLVPETPVYAWPLLKERFGVDVVVKHENHTPTGAFKARSSIVFIQRHIERLGMPKGVVSATRGNHGQSMALAARTLGLAATVVVPEGNAAGKNRAMRAFGADLVVEGRDFDISREVAAKICEEQRYLMVPSFHRDIVMGVATCGLELFHAHSDLDVVYVPIGMGSGVCAMITVRDLLGIKTEIVPVVSTHAPAYKLSFEAGHVIETETARTFADGMACRQPLQPALDILMAGAERMIAVSDDEIAEAIRVLYADTHNLAEGAGAASLAAMIQDLDRLPGKKAGVLLTGGNLEETAMADVLAGQTPKV